MLIHAINFRCFFVTENREINVILLVLQCEIELILRGSTATRYL